MDLEAFNYHLPEDLIAQTPCAERDGARMMAVDRGRAAISHARFSDFPGFLKKGDVLVINDSKVIPARLFGRKETGAAIEILLLSRVSMETPLCQRWEVLLRPAKRVSVGARLRFDQGCEAVVVERLSEKKWLLKFVMTIPFPRYLERYGKAPLPPYIKRRSNSAASVDDLDRYQTIYARRPGSVAAPTAGLHFTEKVMAQLSERGVELASVTLHVGYGTFSPISGEQVEEHVMEAEFLQVSEGAAEKINRAERVIAVGTTAVRAIETMADAAGRVNPGSFWSSLFIYPGYRFKRVNALLTNFHLPKSSLFLLVCAFAGTEFMQQAYSLAVADRYRFYSYGDCMLIL
ncbi:MAG: tRNA preQ1(34) S-adenosylmethionine ribosyltransferase-isomerase QueA [Deltaproteobacteria bacterium HGW-Deltaproteobacteria-11]|nr:MAG: tRNA preQ1(34) S-adenosylmethionine ribosyltransferase-isomerase QueA [Deltaproteobacteria bacterium HGW-Deltaproteobacteria-11]